MRYYVFVVQYNRVAKAENRTVPKAFDRENDAIREFHSQLAKDMGNETLGWSMVMLIDSYGQVEMKEKYIAPPNEEELEESRLASIVNEPIVPIEEFEAEAEAEEE